MKVVIRLSPEQTGLINCSNDVVVEANDGETYGSLKHHLCNFCEQLPGFMGECHILFEKKDNEGNMKRLFNAMELKEDYKEGDIIYWKCISPDFLTQTQSKRKNSEVIHEQPKKKTKLNEEDLEYEKRRSDFMLRLGEKNEKKKINPINTAAVWSEIKIITNKDKNNNNEKYISIPENKIGILSNYLKRVKIKCKINDKMSNDDIQLIKIPSNFNRSDKELLQDLETFQVMRFNYEIWHDCLSSITITGLHGTVYPFVFPATYIPLSQIQIDALITSYSTKNSSPEISKLIKQINKAIIAEYGNLEKHKQISFFPRLSTLSPKDITDQQSNMKELQIKNGEELISLFLKSNRIKFSLQAYQRFNDPEKKLSIILVEWQQIEKKGEFRCFIYKEKITAISQYHCYSSFGFTEKDKESISAAIMNLWEGISLYIPYEDCIMDVYIDFSTDEQLVTIIEFNSFGGDLTSGSALYNWETDKHILYAVDVIKPDVRIVEDTLKDSKSESNEDDYDEDLK